MKWIELRQAEIVKLNSNGNEYIPKAVSWSKTRYDQNNLDQDWVCRYLFQHDDFWDISTFTFFSGHSSGYVCAQRKNLNSCEGLQCRSRTINNHSQWAEESDRTWSFFVIISQIADLAQISVERVFYLVASAGGESDSRRWTLVRDNWSHALQRRMTSMQWSVFVQQRWLFLQLQHACFTIDTVSMMSELI